jgi:hypothetical protein
MTNASLKRPATAVLAVVLFVAVALAGVSAADPGNGKGNANGHNKQAAPPSTTSAAPAPSPSSAAKQYGRHRVMLCHKHHTISVAQPAVKAHLAHGDKLGAC